MTIEDHGRGLTSRASGALRTCPGCGGRGARRGRGARLPRCSPTTGIRASRPTTIASPDEEERRAADRRAAPAGATDDRGGRDRADDGADDAAAGADPAVDEEAGDDADDDRAEQRRGDAEAEAGEHAREGDSRRDPDPDGDPDLVPVTHSERSVYGLALLLQPPDHVDAECAGPGAVDDAMVEGDRDVPGLAHDDLSVADDGVRPDAV